MPPFFHTAAATAGNERSRWTTRKCKKIPGDVKESIILMDLASKAIISKFSELMNDRRKQTSALKREKII